MTCNTFFTLLALLTLLAVGLDVRGIYIETDH